jgi:hypothetical protein
VGNFGYFDKKKLFIAFFVKSDSHRAMEKTQQKNTSTAIPDNPFEEFLTVSEAAEWLGYTKETLAQLRKNGGGPKYYQPAGTGTRVWYSKNDLREWFERGLVDPEKGKEGE